MQRLAVKITKWRRSSPYLVQSYSGMNQSASNTPEILNLVPGISS